MKKLSLQDYQEIRHWMYRNARPLEMALWKYLFEAGRSDEILTVLSFYQNKDGGFGHALEEDSWNPNSSPYTTNHVIELLESIDFHDLEHPIYNGIVKYLESGDGCNGDGWLFSIPSNDEYAHAPWWSYSEENNAAESTGVTAGIVSFILVNLKDNTMLYDKALTLTGKLLYKLMSEEKFGEVGIAGYCKLLDSIEASGLAERFDMESLREKVHKLVNDAIVRDPNQWAIYGKRPSDFIVSKDSIYYAENEEIMEKELDYLIESRLYGDVWGITWSWFDNNEKYAKAFAISENWWKGTRCIQTMALLRNFGRIDEPVPITEYS